MRSAEQERIRALQEIADSLAGEERGGWLAKAVAGSLQARMDQAAAEQRTTAEQIEAVLISGVTGVNLLAELWRRFPTATRADVFLGAVMAMTTMEARAVWAEIEMAVRLMEAA